LYLLVLGSKGFQFESLRISKQKLVEFILALEYSNGIAQYDPT